MKRPQWLSPVNFLVLLLVVVLGAGFLVGRLRPSAGPVEQPPAAGESVQQSNAAGDVAASGPATPTVSAGEQASAYFTQARTDYDNEDWEAALSKFNAAIELSPRYAMAYLFRGLTYAHLQENERAIQDLNTYLEISNDDLNRPQVEGLIQRLESGSP